MRPILLTTLFSLLLLPAAALATPPLLTPPPRALEVEGGPAAPLQAAEDKARCKVHFVLATTKPGPVDKGLDGIRKALKRVPGGHKSFKLLSKAELTIPRGTTRTAPVPGGAQMSIKFIEKLLEGEKKLKLRLQIKIPPKVKNLIQTLPNGRTWPGVVLPHKDGNLIVALTCRAQ